MYYQLESLQDDANAKLLGCQSSIQLYQGKEKIVQTNLYTGNYLKMPSKEFESIYFLPGKREIFILT